MENELKILDLLEKIWGAIKGKDKQAQGLKELNIALAAAQAEYTVARRSRRNMDLNEQFEDLSDVMDASRPYLAKNGLSVTFPISSSEDQGTMLSCILLHSSGQSIESKVRVLPAKNDPRSFASEVAFMKRILYSGLVGVCAEDEDDDADGAMEEYRKADAKRSALSSKADPREDKVPVTKEQLEELEYELEDNSDIAEKILDAYSIRDLASMPKARYHEAIKRIREIKDARTRKR